MKCAEHLGNVNELLESTQELNRYTPDHYQETFTILNDLGFPKHKFSYMISQHPKLLTMNEQKIRSAFNDWLLLDFGDRETRELIGKHPELLELKNFKKIHDNLSVITDFVGKKHGYKVILTTPEVINDKVNNINEKVKYLRDKMKVDTVEVYKSSVFARSLFKIKARHMFMYRLGIYFTPKKDAEKPVIKKNPPLYKIMDTSDKTFATKICHVTIEEYETFEELYKKELEKEGEEIDEDEDVSYKEFDN